MGDGFVAFGHDELAGASPRCIGDVIPCPVCGHTHVVRGGKDESGTESDLLMYVRCGDVSYLCGVSGRAVPFGPRT